MNIFAKLYVGVYTHPKFIKAGYEASGYWMHALAYLRHHESSDGFLDDELITVPLSGKRAQCRRLCEKLVSVGLFGKVERGYVLLHYAAKNETKADIEAAKAASRERKARSRQPSYGPPPDTPDPPLEDEGEADVTRDRGGAVTRDSLDGVTRPEVVAVTRESRVPSRLCLCLSSGLPSGSCLVCSSEQTNAARDREQPDGVVQRGGGSTVEVSPAPLPPTAGPGARRPLPPSERAVSGSYWLEAFTAGITAATGRPCSAGRMYVGTLERIVERHAPGRDAPAACAFLRDEAQAFGKLWDGKYPAKGLTPDGLERWLNDGRQRPPVFGKQRIVQLPPEQWHDDDWSDLTRKRTDKETE